MNDRNLQAVRKMYEAMNRGDVMAMIEMVAEEVVWGYEVAHSDAPWHTTVHGKRGITRYIGALIENVQIQRIEPQQFVVSDQQVVARVKTEYTVRRTGKRVAVEQVHWWTFDQAGRVVRLWHWEDTAAVLEAWDTKAE